MSNPIQRRLRLCFDQQSWHWWAVAAPFPCMWYCCSSSAQRCRSDTCTHCNWDGWWLWSRNNWSRHWTGARIQSPPSHSTTLDWPCNGPPSAHIVGCKWCRHKSANYWTKCAGRRCTGIGQRSLIHRPQFGRIIFCRRLLQARKW